MDRNDLRSQSLDLLRFPLAIVVMTIHVWFPGVADATADVPALNALSGLVAGLLWDQSVPVYFFISGFAFFLNVDMSAATYRRKLRNRTKSLLIPYIIWNTLAIAKLLLFALPCLGFLFADQRTLADMDLSAGAVAWSYWDISRGIMHTPLVTGEIYPIDTPLWFLRDLMIVVVTTPLLHIALRGGVSRHDGAALRGMGGVGLLPAGAPQPAADGLLLLRLGSGHQHQRQGHLR